MTPIFIPSPDFISLVYTFPLAHYHFIYQVPICYTRYEMINVFLDESGNLGKGGEFFTIAAVAFSQPKGQIRLKRLMKKLCLTYSLDGVPLRELKANGLSFPQKQEVLRRIALRADHEIFYITAQKRHVTMLQQGRDKNLVYNYLAGILALEIIKKYNDDICLKFDQRTTKVASMNSLKDYVKLKAYTTGSFQHSIEANQFDSHSIYNLQTADILAGTINGSYVRQNRHLLQIIEQRLEAKIEFPITKFDKRLY
jgi:hypothetical protein